jgi:hypothetical protein
MGEILAHAELHNHRKGPRGDSHDQRDESNGRNGQGNVATER